MHHGGLADNHKQLNMWYGASKGLQCDIIIYNLMKMRHTLSHNHGSIMQNVFSLFLGRVCRRNLVFLGGGIQFGVIGEFHLPSMKAFIGTIMLTHTGMRYFYDLLK